MAPANVDAAVRYQLGELAAEMRTLRDAMRRIQERADRAVESRAAPRRRMDELVGRVFHLETSTATIVADVAEMKPVTDGVKRWKPMGIGALSVTGIVGMALGVSFGEAIRGFVLATGGQV